MRNNWDHLLVMQALKVLLTEIEKIGAEVALIKAHLDRMEETGLTVNLSVAGMDEGEEESEEETSPF